VTRRRLGTGTSQAKPGCRARASRANPHLQGRHRDPTWAKCAQWMGAVALRATLTTLGPCAAAAQLPPWEDDSGQVLAGPDPSQSAAHLDGPALDVRMVVFVGGSTHRSDRACQRAEALFRHRTLLRFTRRLLRNDVGVRRRSGPRRWRLVARVVADRGGRLLRGVSSFSWPCGQQFRPKK